jgi:hypothetical protein
MNYIQKKRLDHFVGVTILIYTKAKVRDESQAFCIENLLILREDGDNNRSFQFAHSCSYIEDILML